MIVWHDIVSRTSLNFVLDAFHPFQLKSDQLEKAMSPMIYPENQTLLFLFCIAPRCYSPCIIYASLLFYLLIELFQ